MNKQTARFTNASGNLDILLKPGKTGISVFVRTRRPGERAVIGCRNTFVETSTRNEVETAKLAQAKFDELVVATEAKGWARKSSGTGPVGSQFNEIPDPAAMPVGAPLAGKKAEPEAPAAAGPVAVKKTNGGKK